MSIILVCSSEIGSANTYQCKICSGNLPIDPILRKWSLKCKNVPNFDDSAKCFDTILNEKYDYMNPSKNCKIH